MASHFPDQPGYTLKLFTDEESAKFGDFCTGGFTVKLKQFQLQVPLLEQAPRNGGHTGSCRILVEREGSQVTITSISMRFWLIA